MLYGGAVYQRYELEAYLGDFVGNYDIEAIESQLTEFDDNGNRRWKLVYLENESAFLDLLAACEVEKC